MSLCESSQNVYLFSWETVLDSALCKFVSDVHQLNFMFFFMSACVCQPHGLDPEGVHIIEVPIMIIIDVKFACFDMKFCMFVFNVCHEFSDINECLSDPCKETEYCANTQGSYSCLSK